MSTRSAQPASATRGRARRGKQASSSASIPFVESASPVASLLPPSEDSLGPAAAEEDNSEFGDVSIASSVGGGEDSVTPSTQRKKRSRLDSSVDTSTPAPSIETPSATPASVAGDASTKIRIPYSKLRSSGVLGSPLFPSTDPMSAPDASGGGGGTTPKLKIQYSRPGQPTERSGFLRLDFPELADYPSTARALAAASKGEQYGNVAKRDVEALRDEFERIRVELRNFDLEVRRELDSMAETRTPGLPDPRSSPALQRRRMEPQPLRQSTSSVILDPNKKRLKKATSRGRDEDEDESIDVLDIDAKSKQKRDQRKRDKDAFETTSAADSKKYNLKARGKDKKSKSKKAGEDEEGEQESGEDAESLDAANLLSTAGGPSNPFWAFIHQFIRDITEDDLLLLLPRHLSAVDPAFLIPALGRHWTEFRKPKIDDADGGAGEADGEIQPIYCGDLTQRILASLIEDRLLDQMDAAAAAAQQRPPPVDGAAPAPPSSSTTPPTAAVVAPAPVAATPAPPPPSTTATTPPPSVATAAAAAAVASTPQPPSAPSSVPATPLPTAPPLDSSAFEFAEMEASLPLSHPPTGDYSFATMLSLEERIKMELKTLGLFDPEENPLNHAQEKEEDNEIVQEIKMLQNQLREQVAKNNAAREKILDVAFVRVSDQKKDRDVRGAHGELEKAYIRVMQKRKPKRKKGPGRKGG